MMKFYGLILSFVYPFVGFGLSYALWPGITYNRLSLEMNLVFLFILMTSMIVLTKKYYLSRPKGLLILFTISVFLLLNFSLSALTDWVNKSDDIDSDGKGMSWIIVLPLSFLFSIVWGVVFDRLKNKIKARKES